MSPATISHSRRLVLRSYERSSSRPTPAKRAESQDPKPPAVIMGPRFRGDDPTRPHDVKQPISFPRRISAPGACNLASLTRIEGWAERRETFGCLRGTRGARHLASKTRVNALMTRRTRRLRGALRPMTRRTAGGNNVMISTLISAGVPIVSQIGLTQ